MEGESFCQHKVTVLAAVTGWYPDSALSGIYSLPPVNFISLSLGVGAQQPRMHSLWVEERRIRELPMCTAAHWQVALLCGWKERVCLGLTLCVFTLASHRIGYHWWSDGFHYVLCWSATIWHRAEKQEHRIISSITQETFEPLKSSGSTLNYTDNHKEIAAEKSVVSPFSQGPN